MAHSLTLSIDVVSSLVGDMTHEKRALLLDKMTGNNKDSMDEVLKFVRDPENYSRKIEGEKEPVRVGSTIYVSIESLWGSHIDKAIEAGRVLGNSVIAAKIVSFSFFPELKLKVQFYKYKGDPEEIHNHYIKPLDLV